MLGVFTLLILSYLTLKYNSGHYAPIKFQPLKTIVADTSIGLLWPVAYYITFEFLVAGLVGNPYQRNPQYTFLAGLHTLTYIIKSVLVEELLFRGAGLYLLWRKLGTKWAITISSVCFGIYHWFSWHALGNPVQMLIIFISTGSMGCVLALAFLRSKSMVLPIALHLGANLATMLIFSKDQSIGPQLLIKSFLQDPTVPPAIISLPVILIHFAGYPIFTMLLVFRFKR